MAQVLHGSAHTTPRVRAELQRSQESTRALATGYSLNPKTVAKWRGRTTTADAPMGPSNPRSTVLTPVEEAMVVEFRRRTLLPLDDVSSMPAPHDPEADPQRAPPLPRAPRHLPPARKGGQDLEAQPLCRDRDRLRPYRHLRALPRFRQALHVRGDRPNLEVHLRRVAERTQTHTPRKQPSCATSSSARAVQDPHHAHRQRHALRQSARSNRSGTTAHLRGHMFERVCREHGIAHRLRKPYHPWTKQQAERMNRTLKATPPVKAGLYHYDQLSTAPQGPRPRLPGCLQLRSKDLKALRWLTSLRRCPSDLDQ